jgi:hypothetical protein
MLRRLPAFRLWIRSECVEGHEEVSVEDSVFDVTTALNNRAYIVIEQKLTEEGKNRKVDVSEVVSGEMAAGDHADMYLRAGRVMNHELGMGTMISESL